MLKSIRALFRSVEEPISAEEDPSGRERQVRLAACALMLEIAYADDEFSDDERAHLVASIRRQWALDPDEAEELIGLAERQRAKAVDLWRFTRLIKEHYSLGQKMVLAETMWGLVYADGELSSKEDYLMRKISKLLDLKAGYLTEARKRAEGEERSGPVSPVD